MQNILLNLNNTLSCSTTSFNFSLASTFLQVNYEFDSLVGKTYHDPLAGWSADVMIHIVFIKWEMHIWRGGNKNIAWKIEAKERIYDVRLWSLWIHGKGW
jgi:hypothetical protein